MRRTVCLECVAVCGLMQLLMTYLVVYMVMAPTSEVVHSDSRLLLSLADPTGPKIEASSEDKSQEVIDNLVPFISSDQGLVDKWRTHKTHMFSSTGSDWRLLSESRQVCLATQTSIDRVHWLLTTVESWSGPISVAVFTPDLEYDISVRYISYLRTCFPKVMRQVSFHFVYPVAHPMRESEELSALLSGHAVTCEQDPQEFLQFLLQIQVNFWYLIRNQYLSLHFLHYTKIRNVVFLF